MAPWAWAAVVLLALGAHAAAVAADSAPNGFQLAWTLQSPKLSQVCPIKPVAGLWLNVRFFYRPASRKP